MRSINHFGNGPSYAKKGGHTPRQARMPLLSAPGRPKSFPIEYTLNLASSHLPVHWKDYLGWKTAVAT
jgi:hypothetical protein